MAPQRWNVRISIVAVNRIDLNFDIMVDDGWFEWWMIWTTDHLVMIFLRNPILLISQCMEMNRWISLHFSRVQTIPVRKLTIDDNELRRLALGNGSVNSVVGKLPASYQRVFIHKKSYG